MKRVLGAAAAALLVAAAATPGSAHPPGTPAGPPPLGGFQLRLGLFMPTGDSNFWDETEQVFTLDAGDFDEFIVGFSFVRPFNNHVELGFNVDFFSETVLSEVQGVVDEDGFPILHDTELSIVPLTVDVRFLPGGRYRVRPDGRYIPHPVFYIGGGVGFTLWEYEEYGQFADFVSETVINGDFQDDGAALEVHALAGFEMPVSRATNILFEARYSISEDDLGGDFGGLQNDELDLGGLAVYGGVSFQF